MTTRIGIPAVAITFVGLLVACSGGNSPSGLTCSTASDCGAGQVCTNGTCLLPDGGIPPGGGDGGSGSDGGSGNDGGTGSDGGTHSDGGVGTLPDGGACVNLQCQQVSCPSGGTTSITGKVYDPSGQVPLYNAVVYVPNGQLEPFKDGVTCDTCGTFTSGSPLVITLTGSDGSFKLDNVPAGSNIPLVYQIGKWRRMVTIPSVSACQPNPLTDVNQQRMPRNASEGDIPKMAIATGNADPFECLLLKMGIDKAEFTVPSGGGHVQMYRANGLNTNPAAPDAGALWDDAGTLDQYDVVLLPCEGGEYKKTAAETKNIVDYTSAGGRVFATHYSYVWTAYGTAPFPSTASWHPTGGTSNAPPDPFYVNINKSFPKGQAFADWLGNVNALDGGVLMVHQTRDDVGAVNVDGGTTEWLSANNPNYGNGLSVQHLTFNTPYNPPPLPDGGPGLQCGRVVYSDFHVTTNATNGGSTFPGACVAGQAMTEQEKALVFMLFDVSSCVQSDATAPSVCGGAGKACSTGGDCCSGLACLDSAGAACTGSGCTCQVIIN